MGEATLLVDRRGARLELAPGEVVVLRLPDGDQQRVGLRALGSIVLMGQVQLCSKLLRAAQEAEVALLLLPLRGPGAGRILLPEPRARLGRRLAQYRAHFDPARRLALARTLVQSKIGEQARWLVAHGLEADFAALREQAAEAADLDILRGIEGAAAARYFRLWGGLWDAAWGFRTRNRRPPRDPVNALISLGYTLAGNYVGRIAGRQGLDPAVGFLHEPDRHRHALALDLLEPLRPLVDQRVWGLAADGLLTPEQFTRDARTGCRLDKAARGVFFGEWLGAEETWFQAPARRATALVLAAIRREGA